MYRLTGRKTPTYLLTYSLSPSPPPTRFLLSSRSLFLLHTHTHIACKLRGFVRVTCVRRERGIGRGGGGGGGQRRKKLPRQIERDRDRETETEKTEEATPTWRERRTRTRNGGSESDRKGGGGGGREREKWRKRLRQEERWCLRYRPSRPGVILWMCAGATWQSEARWWLYLFFLAKPPFRPEWRWRESFWLVCALPNLRLRDGCVSGSKRLDAH